MRRLANTIPYLNRRIAKRQHQGQALVEFAMISLVLFMLLIGIMEMGRMLFIWTQLASAAQEGTRYGVTHPLEIIDPGSIGTYPCTSGNTDPCNIVAQARARVVLLDPNNVSVLVGYDDGAGNTIS